MTLTHEAAGGRSRRWRGWRAVLKAGALTLAAALAIPTLPMLAASAAQAADTANVTFSNVTVEEGSRALTDDGFLPASNTLVVNEWNPGTVAGSAGQYVMFGFEVSIADGSLPGQTFSIELPEYWAYRTGGAPAPLTDQDGNVMATGAVTTVNGKRVLTYTLQEYVRDRVDMAAAAKIQVQELSDPNRPVGDYVAPVNTGTGQELVELKTRVPEAIWYTPALSMSWSGNTTTPTGGVELRSWPSFDGKSDVTATVYAGPGYIFDCDALRNQDPTKRVGIGLVDIGSTKNSLPTSEWLLDPSDYTLTCDGGSFTIHMPASSWTSADAETGQVLRVITSRIPTDDSWQQDGAVFAYADLDQNGRVTELDGRSAPGGSTGSGTSNQLPPGAFTTLMFQDMNGNNVFDEGTDTVLPNIEVRVSGTAENGSTVDVTVTTDDQGRARATLPQGEYQATIVNPPAGMTQVTPNVGDDAVDSDFDLGAVTVPVKSRETTARDGGFFVPMSTFKIEKSVTGGAASWVADNTAFTVAYSYPAGASYPAGSGELTILADGTQVESPQIPVGAVVTLTENDPAPIEGAKWGAPEYSENGFEIASGSVLTEVVVTNPIEPTFGTFSVKKALSGEAASLVAPDTVFTVNYSYPAGAHFEAGEGSLEILADGTPVQSPELPHGAVVTVEEETPAPIENAVWSEPVYSAESVTIVGDSADAEITVTNELNLRYGTFSLKKELTGEAASVVPADTEFTVDFSYPAGPGYEAGAGELVITADGTPVVSPQIPYGAVVTLAERAPEAIPNTVWGEPVLSTDTVTISDFSAGLEVTVTNPIELAYGKFSVAKLIDGDGADRVPADAEFVVDYSYPAGPGYEAGAGELVITADGAVTESGTVPAGAIVSIAERDPADGVDFEWTGVEYSASEATIVADETAALTVTNTAAAVEEPVVPVVPEAPKSPSLPVTGAVAGWTAAAFGAALLAGGAVLLLIRRRKVAEL